MASSWPSSSHQKSITHTVDVRKSEFLKQYYRMTDREAVGHHNDRDSFLSSAGSGSERGSSRSSSAQEYRRLSVLHQYGSNRLSLPKMGESRRSRARRSGRHSVTSQASLRDSRQAQFPFHSMTSSGHGRDADPDASRRASSGSLQPLGRFGERSFLKNDFTPALHTERQMQPHDEDSVVLRSSMPQHGLRPGRLGPICAPPLRTSSQAQFQHIAMSQSDPMLTWMHRRGARGPYAMTNYVRSAIRQDVNLAATGHV